MTDVYCKPTDTHQYLLSDSCHPKRCKEAIAYSQALRIRRICSTDTLYRKRSSELMQHLVSWGLSKRTLLTTRVNKKTLPNRVPLVTTYHTRLPRLSSIVNDNMTILHSYGRLRTAIPDPPLIAFRRPRNLGDILVRARLPSTNSDLNITDQESPQGCSKCNRAVDINGPYVYKYIYINNEKPKKYMFLKSYSANTRHSGAAIYRD